MNSAENAETPPGMSEEDIIFHIMRVMLIENFNMKKGINILGVKDKTAVLKDLQKIHYMKTCELMDASTLTYQDIKDSLA